MGRYIDPHLLPRYRAVNDLLKSLHARETPWAALVGSGSSEPQGDIIVFPGSFNPPTLAHLALLREAPAFAERQSGGHWQIYAALSSHIVDKEAVERMTLLDRVALLESVFAHEARDIGILLLNRGLYVEQARGIRAAFPGVQRLYLLMGYDKIVQVLDPRYYSDRAGALHELFALAELLIAPRGDDGERELQELLARAENRPFANVIHLLPLEERYRRISSTGARAVPALDLVPREVRAFIQETQPYTPPSRQTDGSERDLYAEWTQELQRMLATESDET